MLVSRRCYVAYAVLALFAVAPAVAWGQYVPPPRPTEWYQAPVLQFEDFSTPNEGFFFQYDLLLMTINVPNRSTIGDVDSERIVTVNGVSFNLTNSLNTSFIEPNISGFSRFEFGNMEANRGWIGNVIFGENEQRLFTTGVSFVPSDPQGLLVGYFDGNGDGVDDDLNLNTVYGRHGQDLGTPDSSSPTGYTLPLDGTPDVGAPIDAGDQVTWLVTFDDFDARNFTEMTGVEWMYAWRRPTARGHSLDLFGGIRYLQINEQFSFTGSGGVLDTTSLTTDVDNGIVGPQVGGRWIYRNGFFSLAAESRFLLGVNFQGAQQTGSIASNAQATGTNEPAALFPNSASYATNAEYFAPGAEIRVDSRFNINRYVALRLGYTGMFLGGIGRASPKVVYELPNFGLSSGASQEALLANALTLGVEVNR
jgi:hypothetical protein